MVSCDVEKRSLSVNYNWSNKNECLTINRLHRQINKKHINKLTNNLTEDDDFFEDFSMLI